MIFAYVPLLHNFATSRQHLCVCSAGTALFSDGYANGVIGNGKQLVFLARNLTNSAAKSIPVSLPLAGFIAEDRRIDHLSSENIISRGCEAP